MRTGIEVSVTDYQRKRPATPRRLPRSHGKVFYQVLVASATPIKRMLVRVARGSDWLDKMLIQLADARHLKSGWNGYGAPPPGELAVDFAKRFLYCLHDEGVLPARLAASAVGGIGITIGEDTRHAYVEFCNNGTNHLMLYDFAGDADPIVTPIRDAGISQIIGQLRDYLDASSGGNAPKWTTTNWAV